MDIGQRNDDKGQQIALCLSGGGFRAMMFHTGALLSKDNRGESIHDRLVKALVKVEGTLKAHEKKWG